MGNNQFGTLNDEITSASFADQNFTGSYASVQGWRLTQEDAHSLILDLPGEHKASFFGVFDGHGSSRVSERASEILWRHLIENDNFKKANFKEALEESFLSFDKEVNEVINAQLAGTTAVCLLIVDNIVYCANIGDSRGVACVNCQCVPLSCDHKPDNPLELKRILAAGGYVLGNRVNGNLALSRAFGDFHYKGNHLLPPEQQIVSPFPDIKMLDLNDDVDFLVLACDGIWDVLTSEEVVEFVITRLEQTMEPRLICEQLTTRCLATDYELVIGCDNMTVLLICYTRGRSWTDYCTDIFDKNTRRLGAPRTRPTLEAGATNVDMIEPSKTSSSTGDTNDPNRLVRDDYYKIFDNVLSTPFSVGATDESSTSNSGIEKDTIDEELVAMTEAKKEENQDGKEMPVLRMENQEPELEEACTITELPETGDDQQDCNNDNVKSSEDKNVNVVIEEEPINNHDDNEIKSEENEQCKITEEEEENAEEATESNQQLQSDACQKLEDVENDDDHGCIIATNDDECSSDRTKDEPEVEQVPDDQESSEAQKTEETEEQNQVDTSNSESLSDDAES